MSADFKLFLEFWRVATLEFGSRWAALVDVDHVRFVGRRLVGALAGCFALFLSRPIHHDDLVGSDATIQEPSLRSELILLA